MDKSACCPSMKTRVQIVSIHIKSRARAHGSVTNVGSVASRDKTIPWGLAGCQLSSSFSERPRVKTMRWRVAEQGTRRVSSACT